MTSRAGLGGLGGVVAAGAGLAAAELLTGYLHQRLSPLQAAAERIIALTPGAVAEGAISRVGHADKPLLVAGTLLGFFVLGAAGGVLSCWSLLGGESVFVLLGAAGVAAVWTTAPTEQLSLVPAVGGALVGIAALAVLTARLRRGQIAARTPVTGSGPMPAAQLDRRTFLWTAGAVAAGAVAAGAIGRWLAASTAAVESARAKLRLPIRRLVAAPPGVSVGVAGVSPWLTPVPAFYRVDTALSPPQLLPEHWSLRIHGMVGRVVHLTYQDLLRLGLEQHWVTLCCVSNAVGGNLIGNALWAGVPVRKVLALARPGGGADVVYSRSVDGWTATTPLSALMDARPALLAVAMNGEPLTADHGFPVRLVVPGLYGYVSATKWVVDLQVTRFSDVTAFWTERGWSARGPVKTESRIDVPRSGARLDSGVVAVAGVAWAQHRGIAKVEVRADGGPWREATLAADPTVDSWRQWVYHWDATSGSHRLQVRATDDRGVTQTPDFSGPPPNGASGWHTIGVRVA
ncbi:MAG TPA: molybdopterin-dependent oxidoreductase [Nocardioidaceae bacterium]|nr:molybdopterin-dependent oxidoreductase [Nocardioidaceae bacterium]